LHNDPDIFDYRSFLVEHDEENEFPAVLFEYYLPVLVELNIRKNIHRQEKKNIYLRIHVGA
jgi:hypothetical protein